MCQILSWSNWAQLHGFTSAEDLPRCLEMGGERNLPVKCYLDWQLIPKLNSSSKMQKYLVENPDIIVKSPFFHWSQKIQRIVGSFCNLVGEGHMNIVSLLKYLHPTWKMGSEKDSWADVGQAEFFWRDALLLCHGKCRKVMGRGQGRQSRVRLETD